MDVSVRNLIKHSYNNLVDNVWSSQHASWFAMTFYTADECSTPAADCVDNSTCINSPDGFACLCDFGLTGDGRMGGSGCTGKNYA